MTRTLPLSIDFNARPRPEVQSPVGAQSLKIEAWQASPLALPIVVMKHGIPADLTGISSITFLAFGRQGDTTPLISETITPASAATSGRHGIFEFTGTQMNISVPTNSTRVLYAEIRMVEGAEIITIAAGTLTLTFSTASLTLSPAPTPPDTSLTAAEAAATYLAHDSDGGLNKRGTVSLTSGQTDGTVTFSTAFGATPSQVFLTVEAPASAGTLDATATLLFAVAHSRSTTAFKFALSGATGDASHKLHWQAIK